MSFYVTCFDGIVSEINSGDIFLQKRTIILRQIHSYLITKYDCGCNTTHKIIKDKGWLSLRVDEALEIF